MDKYLKHVNYGIIFNIAKPDCLLLVSNTNLNIVHTIDSQILFSLYKWPSLDVRI